MAKNKLRQKKMIQARQRDEDRRPITWLKNSDGSFTWYTKDWVELKNMNRQLTPDE